MTRKKVTNKHKSKFLNVRLSRLSDKYFAEVIKLRELDPRVKEAVANLKLSTGYKELTTQSPEFKRLAKKYEKQIKRAIELGDDQ